MTAEEMRALKLHFQFIGTTWTERNVIEACRICSIRKPNPVRPRQAAVGEDVEGAAWERAAAA
jgi:hypothetical protein